MKPIDRLKALAAAPSHDGTPEEDAALGALLISAEESLAMAMAIGTPTSNELGALISLSYQLGRRVERDAHGPAHPASEGAH